MLIKRYVILGIFFIFTGPAYSKPLSLLSTKSYSALTVKQRKAYVQILRTEWNKFEKRHRVTSKTPVAWTQLLLPYAYAQSLKCIIGGQVIETVKNAKGRDVCPTRTNPCTAERISDGFQCSALYGNVCVSRVPIEKISDTCLAESQSKDLTPQEYDLVRQQIEGDFKALCESGVTHPSTQDGCASLLKKFESLGKQELTRETLTNGVPTSIAPIGSVKEECPNGGSKDPETGLIRKLIVPKFSFDESRKCLYERNKRNLEQLANTGCLPGLKDNQDKPFTTRIEYLNTLDASTRYKDVIIENMEVLKNPLPGTVGKQQYEYEVTILEPFKSSNNKTILTRRTVKMYRNVYTNLSCQTCGPNQYCNSENKCEETFVKGLDLKSGSGTMIDFPIKLSNVNRKDVMPSKFQGLQSDYDQIVAERVLLSDDCKLVGALKDADLYRPEAIFGNGGENRGSK